MNVISRALAALRWLLALVGLAALVVGGMLAWPARQPPELTSISNARKSIDFSALPAVDRFQARDGTDLAYRHYAAHGPATGRIAVVLHGSSGSSRGTIHALSAALAERGVETFAVDIRGHGSSGTRGDIRYIGQLEDDLADLVGEIRKTSPAALLTLIGHSSGGGFALRVAGSPIQHLFPRTVLLAPYLGYDAPSSRSDDGHWASPDIPRFLALTLLRQLGLTWAESLPTIAFAVPPDSVRLQNATYSFRLMLNFGPGSDFRQNLAAATRPMAVFAGSADELMLSGKYQEAVGNRASVRILDGISHMGIVSNPAALSIIVDDVATTGLSS
jgi:alpha-beta hydrolase superfamily lysophospholipase